MDDRMLRYYNRELQHLRDVGGEFARDFPKVAGRLGLDAFECADPYVERLLEGFAFMAARVQLKIDSEFPRFVQQLLENVNPSLLCPIPSMLTVRFEPSLTKGPLNEGPIVPRRSVLQSELEEDTKTHCQYTTAHDVRLWPIEIVEAAYHTRELPALGLPDTHGARAGIRLRLRQTVPFEFAELPMDDLVLHLRGDQGVAGALYEQLVGRAVGHVVHSPTRPPTSAVRQGAEHVEPAGLHDDESLLPVDPRVFDGYRMLREYFAFPERLLYIRLTGLGEGLRRIEGDTVDITVLLEEPDIELEGVIDAENFALFCTPAVNLFKKRLDRVQLSEQRSEFQLIADRTAPLDYEIHSLLDVTGIGSRGQGGDRAFRSFYDIRDRGWTDEGGFYALSRVPRRLSERERGGRRRSLNYAGSETYIALVDTEGAPADVDLRQLAIEAWCTNRDLPLHLPLGRGSTDFSLAAGLPVESIRGIGTPTVPQPPPPDGEMAWRLVSQLNFNYLTIQDTPAGEAAQSLRELLALYGDASRAEVRRQIEGVVGVESRPIVRRVGGAGPTSFVRGLEVTVTLDDFAFEGTGICLLGAVLERLFARFVSLNSFTETHIRSARRGVIKRWPPRTGHDHGI